MIIEKDSDRETLGRMVGEKVEMRFSDAARGILMDNFAKNLYSRPKEAVLREYSTNAWDAQIEAGTTNKAIQVTLPSPLNPVLQIRDFGIGLDQQGIIDVYSQYGASTKRDSNDFNGTLGLGGKSAFAYSDQFNVVSVKNGVRIEVQVTRNEDGTGDMVTVDERQTDEPTGTLIKIPTKRGDTFEEEAKKLYRWFPKDSVKVNGRTAQHFDPAAEEAIEVAPSLWVVKNNGRYGEHDDQIVMGMIAYPTRLNTGLNRRQYHVVSYAPMGSVQFNPSRETLLNNSVTRRGLNAVLGDYKAGIISTVQKHIDAAPTRAKAASVVSNWRDIVPTNVTPSGGYKYKGEIVPQNLDIADSEPPMRTLAAVKSGYHNSHGKTRRIDSGYFCGALWVEGYAVEKLSSAQAQKARKYAVDNELSIPKGIIMVKEIPASMHPWIETVVSYETIKAVKLPQPPRTYVSSAIGRIPGSYDLYTTEPTQMLTGNDGVVTKYRRMTGVPADMFKTWKPKLFYYIGSTSESGYIRQGLAQVCPQGYTLVCIGRAREAKLKRGFPNITQATDEIKAGWKKWEQGVGKDVPLAMAIQRDYTARDYKHLPYGQIHDPELANYARLAAMDLTSVSSIGTVFSRVLGVSIAQPDVKDFDDDYPMLNIPRYDVSKKLVKHAVLYINSVYAARAAGATL